MPLLAIFLLFISGVAKAHGNIDILPKSNNKNSGSPFFGFSTAVNFYNAYRGEGREEINTAGNALSAFAGYSYGNLIFIGGYEHTFAPITYDGAFNSLQNGNLRQHPSPRKIWLPGQDSNLRPIG